MDNTINPEIKEAELSLIRKTLIGGSLGMITIIGYSLTITGTGTRIFFILLLLAISTFIVGFFTGTLFGMPKRNTVNDSDYSLNNSLVEISDWLTKIIVGLSLVNLHQIPVYLQRLGNYVSEAASSKGQSLDVMAMAIVVLSSVLGLYIGYNYMRLVLSQKYKQADDNMLRKELERKELQVKAMLDETNNTPTTPLVVSTEQNIEEMKTRALEKLNKGLIKNPNDPQKYQWGKQAALNGRRLEAEVKELTKQLYSVTIRVRSTTIEKPLKDGEVVLFALHQTFGTPPFRYVKAMNGIAEIKLISQGSYTVGAMLDHGATELELDLAELKDTTEHFRNN